MQRQDPDGILKMFCPGVGLLLLCERVTAVVKVLLISRMFLCARTPELDRNQVNKNFLSRVYPGDFLKSRNHGLGITRRCALHDFVLHLMRILNGDARELPWCICTLVGGNNTRIESSVREP